MKRGLERFDNAGSHEKARIAGEQIKAALEVVKANLGFFLYPFIHPQGFQSWVEQSNHKNAIAKFTAGLMDLGLIGSDEETKIIKGRYVDVMMSHEYSLLSESSTDNKAEQVKLKAPKVNTVENGYLKELEKLFDKYQFQLPQLFLSEELRLAIAEFNAEHSEDVGRIFQRSNLTGKINNSANAILDSISYKTAALKRRGGEALASIVPVVVLNFKKMLSEFTKSDVDFQHDKYDSFNAICNNYKNILSLITDVTIKTNELRGSVNSLVVDYLEFMTDQIWIVLAKYSGNNFHVHVEKANEFSEAIVRYRNLFELIKNDDPKISQMKKLITCMGKINRKASDLENRGYFEEAKTARNLLYSLGRSLSVFCNGDMSDNTNLKEFKKHCKNDILKARPILEQHRSSWKVILGNLLMFVLTLGVLYVPICAAKNAFGGNFFFFNSTRSGEIINNTEMALSDFVASKKSA